jgi:hypothetical protein
MQCELDANVEFLVCVAAAGSSLGAGGAGRDRVAADASCRRLLAGRAEAERMMTEKLAAYVEAQAAVIAGTKVRFWAFMKGACAAIGGG